MLLQALQNLQEPAFYKAFSPAFSTLQLTRGLLNTLISVTPFGTEFHLR